MFIGHYGVALATRSRASRVSLGWLFLAVQALDVLFSAFVLTGVEHMRIVPGFTAVNPYELYDMPLSHSLLGTLGWAAAAGLVALALRLGRGPSLVLGFAVFSHFLLDVPMHMPDLTVAGARSARLGLGLWQHPVAAVALEVVCVALGLWLYARDQRPVGRGFWVFAVGLVVLTVLTPLLPAPHAPAAFAVQALVAYLGLAAWAVWVDRGAGREQPAPVHVHGVDVDGVARALPDARRPERADDLLRGVGAPLAVPSAWTDRD